MKLFTQKNLHTLFEWGVVIKGIDSIFEMALGVTLAVSGPAFLNTAIFRLFGDELTETPRDPIWNFLFHGWNGLTPGSQVFWAVIFLAHGIAKLLLVLGLWSKRLWVYPVAIVVFSCFVIYQVVHIAYYPSVLLGALTTFDMLFIFLIANEYRTKTA